jgi:hypothetical protein
MLNTISWQQYITAVLLLTAAWYAYVGLCYYRPELTAFLKIKPAVNPVVPEVAHQMTVVMGAAKPETGISLEEPEKLIFITNSSDDISEQTLPKGPADELVAEAQLLADACPDKTEFLSLFKLLLDKYEVYADEISLPGIIQSLRLPFEVAANEWPLNFTA